MTSAADIAKSLASVIGENDDESTVSQFLSTGYPELDFALTSSWTGGAPVGRIMEISGPPSAGKTAVATSIMANAQKQGGIAGFSDHERSFSLKLAPNLGLDTTPGRFIYKKPRTFEESLVCCINAAKLIREKKLIDPAAPIAWVFDSLASMVPHSVLFDPKTGKERALDSRNMNDNTALSRATSAAMPAFTQYCEELNISAIFLNQIRTKIGVVYGDPRTTPGGDAPKFYASARVMLGATSVKKDKDVIGSQVTAQVIKNKVARPFLTATWRFDFNPDGTGRFNTYRSMIDFLDREKALEKSGNYIVWEGSKYYAGPLAEKLESEGAWQKLIDLLPQRYEPEVVATIDEEEAA